MEVAKSSPAAEPRFAGTSAVATSVLENHGENPKAFPHDHQQMSDHLHHNDNQKETTNEQLNGDNGLGRRHRRHRGSSSSAFSSSSSSSPSSSSGSVRRSEHDQYEDYKYRERSRKSNASSRDHDKKRRNASSRSKERRHGQRRRPASPKRHEEEKRDSHDNNNNDSKKRTHDPSLLESNVYIPPAKRRQIEAALQQQQRLSKDPKRPFSSSREHDGDSKPSALIAQQQQQQRQSWEDQRRIIHRTVNRLNVSTIKPLIHDLFASVNLIRMRGVLAKAVLNAVIVSGQASAATLTSYTKQQQKQQPVTTQQKGDRHADSGSNQPIANVSYAAVYAALIAVLNTKLPEVGELIVHRAILAFRKHYRRKERAACQALAVFLAHLFHQAVVHELVLLQMLTLLLEGDPTDDSVEVAVQLMTISGTALLVVSPAGVRAVLERFRALLHEAHIHRRVQYKIEHVLQLRQRGFRLDGSGGGTENSSSSIPPELDLVEAEDQITFDTNLDDEEITAQDHLNVFNIDPDFEDHEREWSQIRAEVLGVNDGNGSNDDGESETDDDGDDDEGEHHGVDIADNIASANEQENLALVPAASSAMVTVQDLSEADLVHLRRTIYLTIMSSATFEECTHKLAKIDIPIGREAELINMLIECCAQERTFLRYYGLIGSRLCVLRDRWRNAFMTAFEQQYTTIHRLETNKLRNVAKLFAHLLHTDAIPWNVLAIIHLNEDETTSSSRIFLKIILQEMAEAIGMAALKERFQVDQVAQEQQQFLAAPVDPGVALPSSPLPEWYQGLFPMQDNIRDTRYAINFFTSIGLGPLTDGLREYLKMAPKRIMLAAAATATAKTAPSTETALIAHKKTDEDDDSSTSSASSSSSSSDSRSSSSQSTSSSTSSSRQRRSRPRRPRRRSSFSSSSSASSDSSSISRNDRDGDRRRLSSRRHRRRRSLGSSSSSSSNPRRSKADDKQQRGRT